MKLASLFSGIGGFELGFHQAGHNTVLMCEIDQAAREVLAARFPSIKPESDIRKLKSLPGNVDILTAGFPCQDLSSVGNKEGIWGSRSGLVAEVFRLVERSKPEWVLIENVYFMLHLDRGRGMQVITTRLEELGYNWAYRVLDTSGFGLPQRRRRVFILASRNGDPRSVLLTDAGSLEPSEFDPSLPIGFYWTEGAFAAGLTSNGIPPLKGGSAIGIPSPPAILMPDGFVGTPQIEDAEALQGFPRNWTEPAAAIKTSARWKLVGNAVSVPVAKWLAKKLVRGATYNGASDLSLSAFSSWPEAAWSVGGERRAARVGQHLAKKRRVPLSDVLKGELKPLSARASAGFLARARRGKLNFPGGFLERIEKHLERITQG